MDSELFPSSLTNSAGSLLSALTTIMTGRTDQMADPLRDAAQKVPSRPKAPNNDRWSRISEVVWRPVWAGLDTGPGYPVIILLPLAAAARLLHWNANFVLVVNLVAIIFLSELISSSSDELAESLGHLQGALIGATLGNTVELTVCTLRRWSILGTTNILINLFPGRNPRFVARSYYICSIGHGWQHSLGYLIGSTVQYLDMGFGN